MYSSRYWLHARGNITRKRLIIINNLQFITGNFYKENIDRCLTQEINIMSFEFETTPHIRLNVVVPALREWSNLHL